MLYFVSVGLALGYVLFSFLSALGVLQFVAARYRLSGLALLDYAENHTKGYALATLLIACGVLVFFGGQWRAILTPGPAGSELALLFGMSAVCALAFTLILASLSQQLRRGRSTPSSDDMGKTLAVGRGTGRLYLPPNLTTPVPAVALVPGLRSKKSSLILLARRMAQEGLAALVICPDEEVCTYPEVLSIVPAAISELSKQPEIDPQRLGALGHDLGGDLIIRAASMDKHIKALAALAPVLVAVPPSLDLLREMTYPQAMRWVRDREQAILRAELDAIAYVTKIAPRPLLLLYGTEDRVVSRAPVESWEAQQVTSMYVEVLEGIGHFDLVENPMATRTVIQWFKEHL
nr:acetylxylan esterase [Chloroflexota bacterium]